jgi:N-acetyl-1-D-myo-inositol-2-amino-2-deoxy-alpha-D-glucopyranoside deacetylase
MLEIKPDVLVTYDENGGYGHPDHIQAHRVAMAAAAAIEPQFSIQKIYWNIMPESVLQAGIDRMKEAGNNFFQVDNARDLPFCKSDEFVTTKISAPDFVPQKLQALRAHATQINVDGGFFALSNNVGAAALGDEYYTLVKGEKSGPFDDNGYELDLFNGIVPTDS